MQKKLIAVAVQMALMMWERDNRIMAARRRRDAARKAAVQPVAT